MTFWRAVQGGGDTSPQDYFRGALESDQRWTDPLAGRTWQPVYHYGVSETATLSKLGPGDYRVAAALGNGIAPFGISEVIHLDGTVPTTSILIQLLAGPSLSVSALDAQTQKPIALFQAMLVRHDGFPVTRWSMSPWAVWSPEREGRLEFRQLPPGNYRLHVRRPAFSFGQPEYTTGTDPLELKVAAGVDQTITVPLKPVILPDEVIRQRWPFVVTGRVADEQGHGLEDVTITAHCGMGTLRPTGETRSDPDGRYTLRFAGGIRMKDGDRWRVGVQAATISPGKPGFVEANLHRQGNLLMADRMPEPGQDTGWKVEPGKVVLPEQPFPLDFVLLPAATLKGQLVDTRNRPMAGQRVYLSGPELPPSCSVLAEVHTDASGGFQFDNVPPRRSWWFSLADQRDVKSRLVAFQQAGVHQVNLRFLLRDGQRILEVTDMSVK